MPRLTSLRLREDLKRLTDERARIMYEIEALKHKLSGLELAISLIQNDAPPTASRAAPSFDRGGVKVLLLDLLKEAAATGLNASTAVDLARNRGVTLLRGTAASNLSRLKRDKIVVHDGDKYRLPEFSRQPALAVVVGKGS
jgi:hypothetical protein